MLPGDVYDADIKAVRDIIEPIFARRDPGEPVDVVACRANGVATALVLAHAAGEGDALAAYWCHHNMLPATVRRVWTLIVGDEARAASSFPAGAWCGSAWRLLDKGRLTGDAEMDRLLLGLIHARGGYKLEDGLRIVDEERLKALAQLSPPSTPSTQETQ